MIPLIIIAFHGVDRLDWWTMRSKDTLLLFWPFFPLGYFDDVNWISQNIIPSINMVQQKKPSTCNQTPSKLVLVWDQWIPVGAMIVEQFFQQESLAAKKLNGDFSKHEERKTLTVAKTIPNWRLRKSSPFQRFTVFSWGSADRRICLLSCDFGWWFEVVVDSPWIRPATS